MNDPDYGLYPYWGALGKFVQRYSLVEAQMHRVLWTETKTTEVTAQALFSGLRVRDAMSYMRRLAEGEGRELDPWLQKAFSRLGEITTIRDKILHYGFKVGEEGIATVSDITRNLPTKAITFSISIPDLVALEDDTLTILACLNIWHLEKQWSHLGPERLDFERRIAERPWRYTMPPLGRGRPANP